MAFDPVDLSVRVSSTTKDSIFIKWRLENTIRPPRDLVQGFLVRYQAIGSTVVQKSGLLDATVHSYDITHLHENTFYEICVKALVKFNTTVSGSTSGGVSGGGATTAGGVSADSVCITGTTATDSLAVALGSTFGAFLALGFIVFLVFLAKWQHSRKLRKQKLMMSAYDESGVQQLRECDDPKETFLGSDGARIQDEMAMSELSGQSSELSIALYADQLPDTADSDAVLTSVQPSYDLDDASNCLADRAHDVPDWTTVTPYYQSATSDQDADNHLLRPPPIPGVILRPQVPPPGHDHGGSPSFQLPSTSILHDDPRGTQRRSAFQPVVPGSSSSSRTNDASPAADAGEVVHDTDVGDPPRPDPPAYHRPLKPTSSNLW